MKEKNTQNHQKGSVLKNHSRKGKKLIPPFLASMGDKYKPFKWARDIAPEAIWIALLINQYGFIEGTKLVSSLCEIANNSVHDRPAPLFSRFSSFLELNKNEQNLILEKLSYNEHSKITRCLYSLHRICPKHPLSFLYIETDLEALDKDIQPSISKLTILLYDRLSRISALSAASAMFAAIKQGKLKMPKALIDKTIADLEEIENYPDTEKSKSAAGAFRAAAPSNFGVITYKDEILSHDNWIKLFWKEIGMTGNCINNFEIEYEEVSDSLNDKLIIGFRNIAKEQLSNRFKLWQPNLAEVEQHEVISALLARQVTIAIEFANAPTIWTPNTAPIILRSMADLFLTMSWICGDPIRRSKEFLEYGLGAIKLDIAHREKKLKEDLDSESKKAIQEMIDMGKCWLSAQRMEQFIEVNLGNWAGSNTRRMAEETDNLEFYNYVYQPFSNNAHSSWSHIGQFNAVFCNNPSHLPHWMGAIAEFEPEPNWLFLCAKYLDKTFNKFDKFSSIDIDDPKTTDHVITTLNNMYSEDHTSDD